MDAKRLELAGGDVSFFGECPLPPQCGRKVQESNIAPGELNAVRQVIFTLGNAIQGVLVVAIVFRRNGGLQGNPQFAKSILVALKPTLQAFPSHPRFGVLAIPANCREDVLFGET